MRRFLSASALTCRRPLRWPFRSSFIPNANDEIHPAAGIRRHHRRLLGPAAGLLSPGGPGLGSLRLPCLRPLLPPFSPSLFWCPGL